MALNRIASSLDWISDRLKKYALVIEIELFKENVDLIKTFKEDIKALNRKSIYSEVYLEWNEPKFKFSTDKKLTRLVKVEEFKYITYLSLVFIMNYRNIKKFNDFATTNIKQKLENTGIYYELSHGTFIADDVPKTKIVWIDNQYNEIFNNISIQKSSDIGKQIKPLQTRIKNALWLKYGIDDKLSEERIDKIVRTFNKAKFETFWVDKYDKVGKLTH